MAAEEMDHMPFDLDISEMITFKMGEAKGEAEGEARGKVIGEARGEARLLTRRLEKRFGPLSQVLATRIGEASTDQIERWFDREADAAGIEDIFNDVDR